MKKKLIEVALPLDAINRLSAEEKSVPRRGHPQTIHIWWARRPLAACRSVLFASLVDDPSAHPEQFPTETSQEEERARLFKLIEELADWKNYSNIRLLEKARKEIRASCGEEIPTVVDPFCGAGSIPLEAQRLGLSALGGDLNPVAVAVTRSLITIPPLFDGCPAINPRSQSKMRLKHWPGTTGLAEDIKYYGDFVLKKAKSRLVELFPPGPKGEQILAYQWARTVGCPNPACSFVTPLTSTFQLSASKSSQAWIKPHVNRSTNTVEFETVRGDGRPPDGTVKRSGATCLACATKIPLGYIREQGQAGLLGQTLMALVGSGSDRRTYLSPDAAQRRAAEVEGPESVADTELPEKALGFRVQAYGMREHRDLFSNRQLLAMSTFSDLVRESYETILCDAKKVLGEADNRCLKEGGEGARAYTEAVIFYLSFALGRVASYCNTICHWNLRGGSVAGLFARHAIPMSWDYMEINPTANFSGGWSSAVAWIADVLSNRVHTSHAGVAQQLDAAKEISVSHKPIIVCTDPPYYDNIGYADLSDFFYVWLKPLLSKIYPDIFSTLLVPKQDELIASPFRWEGGAEQAKSFFENGLRQAFHLIRKSQHPDFPLTVFYAFKQAETSRQKENGLPGDRTSWSTGWETMLEGLRSAGFMITGTWPIRTEKRGRMISVGTNALASSIVLVCRPRPESDETTTRRDFLVALKDELPDALRTMQLGNIAPVDLAQASIGPGMSVFSRHSRVIESDGSDMTVKTALGLINQVLDEVLSEQESEFDPETRWAITWFAQYGFDEGPFGEAEVLATARAVSVQGLVTAGVASSRAGKVRLLRRDELNDQWQPEADPRLTIWEITQHLIRKLEKEGEAETANLKMKIGQPSDIARDLAYRLYSLCERKGWADEAGYYNSLVVTWPALTPELFELR